MTVDLPRPRESTDPPVIGRGGAYAKGVARRQQILDRAIEVFRTRGGQRTSLRAIAEAIGVSHAALLHYFDSREQLLIAVYDHAEKKRNADPDTPDADSAVGVMVQAAVANAEVPGLVELYSTLVASSLVAGDAKGREYVTERFARVRGDLLARLETDRAEGRIRDDIDLSHVAALIIAASDGLQIQWLLDPTIEFTATLETLATLLRP